MPSSNARRRLPASARHRMDAIATAGRARHAAPVPDWGHARPTVLSRAYQCRVEETSTPRRARAAIEINGDPARLDLEPRWIRAPARQGCACRPTDAHSVDARHSAMVWRWPGRGGCGRRGAQYADTRRSLGGVALKTRVSRFFLLCRRIVGASARAFLTHAPASTSPDACAAGDARRDSRSGRPVFPAASSPVARLRRAAARPPGLSSSRRAMAVPRGRAGDLRACGAAETDIRPGEVRYERRPARSRRLAESSPAIGDLLGAAWQMRRSLNRRVPCAGVPLGLVDAREPGGLCCARRRGHRADYVPVGGSAERHPPARWLGRWAGRRPIDPAPREPALLRPPATKRLILARTRSKCGWPRRHPPHSPAQGLLARASLTKGDLLQFTWTARAAPASRREPW